MKIAFQVEGRTDLAVFLRFVRLIIAAPVEEQVYERRAGGVDEVFRTLRQSAWQAWREGCRGMLVSVDCDDTVPHDEHGDQQPGDCRYCKVQAGLPRLPDRTPLPAFTFVVAVPVRAMEAWLLHFAHRIGIRPPGPPQLLDRKTAKRLLWGSVTPPPSQIEAVLDGILPTLEAADLADLERQQPSFAGFRDAVARWR